MRLLLFSHTGVTAWTDLSCAKRCSSRGWALYASRIWAGVRSVFVSSGNMPSVRASCSTGVRAGRGAHAEAGSHGAEVARLGAGVSAAGLSKHRDRGFLDRHGDPAGRAGGGQERMHGGLDAGAVPIATPRPLQLRLELLDRQPRLFDGGLPAVGVVPGHQGVPDPNDAVALGRRQGGFHDAPDVLGPAAPAGIGPPHDLLPRRVMILEVVPEPPVLPSRPRQDGDEPTVLARQMREARARAEFAVGDVEEVGAADDLAERVPGVHVGHDVTGLAVQGPVVDRHRAVDRHGEDEEQLLEIRPMVLVVAVGNAERGAVAGRRPGRGGVVAREGDRRRVVVQLVQRDLERPNRPDHDAGQEARAVRAEQLVQRAAHLVIAQPRPGPGRQPQQGGVGSGRPLALGRERLALIEDQVAQEDAQDLGWRDPHARVARGHGLLEQRLDVQLLEKGIDQREAADPPRVQTKGRRLLTAHVTSSNITARHACQARVRPAADRGGPLRDPEADAGRPRPRPARQSRGTIHALRTTHVPVHGRPACVPRALLPVDAQDQREDGHPPALAGSGRGLSGVDREPPGPQGPGPPDGGAVAHRDRSDPTHDIRLVTRGKSVRRHG